MASERETPIELLIELARLHGVRLDRARAERLRPQIESLLGRLGGLAERMPTEQAPPPVPAPGSRP